MQPTVTFRSFLLTIIYAAMGIMLFVRCGNEGKNLSDTEIIKSKKDSVEMYNNANSDALITQYHAVSGWDTLNRFSYELDEVFENKEIAYSMKGDIGDISKNDSLYTLKIHGGISAYFNEYLLELEISPFEFAKLKAKISAPINRNGIFIFKPIKISHTYPKLSSEKSGEDDTELTYDFSQRLMRIRGKLIDYYLLKED